MVHFWVLAQKLVSTSEKNIVATFTRETFGSGGNI